MTPRQILAKVRKLLAAPELDDVRQGIELAETLDDPALTATLCRGLSVDGDGKICWAKDSEIARRVKRPHRPWAALALMKLSGDLDGVERLELTGDRRVVDLSPLAGLPRLERLAIDPIGRTTDLSPLTGLPRLAHLTIWGVPSAPALSPVATLPALRHLSLRGGCAFDYALMASLPQLTSLQIAGDHALKDLSALEGLTALESLRLENLQSLQGIAPLAELTTLRELTLEACGFVTALSPLTALPSLESLTIRRCFRLSRLRTIKRLRGLKSLTIARQHHLTTLTFLSGLSALRSLSLLECRRITDLAPLAHLTDLQRLRVTGSALPVAPLAGLRQLGADVSADADGWICQGGERLEGIALYAILQAGLASGGVDLSGVRHLSLVDWVDLTDLGFLAQTPGLETLDLTGCAALVDASPLLALGSLRQAHVARCPKLRPRPPRVSMEEPAAVADWRRQIARSLARAVDRTAAQDARLAAAKAAGLLEQSPDQVDRRMTLAAAARVRQLLGSSDNGLARQGVALLESLDDPALVAEFAAGVSLDERGRLQISSAAGRRGHLRHRSRRGWMALWLLRLGGQLDGAEKITLGAKHGLSDLSPLAGLTGLRQLTIGNAMGLTALAPLAGSAGLERLEIARAWGLRDLAPLGALPSLARLHLYDARDVVDLSPLIGAAPLARLQIRRCQNLRDLSPLRRLQALAHLEVSECWGMHRGGYANGSASTRAAVVKWIGP